MAFHWDSGADTYFLPAASCSISVPWQVSVPIREQLGSRNTSLFFVWQLCRGFATKVWFSGEQLSESHSVLICILYPASYFVFIYIDDASHYKGNSFQSNFLDAISLQETVLSRQTAEQELQQETQSWISNRSFGAWSPQKLGPQEKPNHSSWWTKKPYTDFVSFFITNH